MSSESAERSEQLGDARVCPACGKRYPHGARFCSADGQVLRDDGALSDWLVGSLVADRYYVERQLGIGGMGVVYLARHVYIDRACALKVLRPEFLKNPDALGRFTRGAQNASRISHPNVATVYDFGEIGEDSMYLAMEYIDGVTLSDVLEASGKLSPTRTLIVLAQVASALGAAHDLGIVHRDLKPDNIMIARAGEDVVKVVDFGIARAMVGEGEQVTASSVAVGTPAYMSPEQLAGGNIDARSDIYSLGLVAYVMLTGQLPLGSDGVDLAIRFLQRPKRLRHLDPAVEWPDALQRALDRALSADPDDRQADVKAFAQEVVEAIRRWRPADVSASLTALTRIGADVTVALPAEHIDAWSGALGPASVQTPVWKRAPTVFLFASVMLAAMLAETIYISTRSSPSGRASTTPTQAEIVARVPDSPVTAQARPRQLDSAGAPKSAPDAGGQTSSHASDNGPPARAPEPKSAKARVRPDAKRDVAPLPARHDTLRATAPTSQIPPDSVPLPILPKRSFIRIGTPSDFGAELYINGELVGVPRGSRVYSVTPGLVRLRLHLDTCADWDTTLALFSGDTTTIGTRRPKCPPKETEW